MEDMSARLEKLIIGKGLRSDRQAATDLHKRELFKRLATDLRGMARDVQAVIATHKPDDTKAN
jgi:hypothetical protein